MSEENKRGCAATWDATIAERLTTKGELVRIFKEHCSAWCFQLERGEETGYVHWQCRFRLEKREGYKQAKQRLTAVKEIMPYGANLSITSNKNRNNMFYVSKEKTRVEGPWSDKDRYIPRQIREIKKLYPWQQYIVDNYDVWDTRTINIVYDTKGNNGKSILCGYMRAYGYGFVLPFVNDYKDILRMIYGIDTKRCYLIDMPRAINKDRLYQMYGAIETVKNGYAYDDRYKFKDKNFDSPNIWIFCNSLPDRSMLSQDRWKIWEISDEKELVPYTDV